MRTCDLHSGQRRLVDKCAEPQATPCLRAHYASLRANVTKALKAKRKAAVLAACDKAEAAFERYGWPDNWHYLERARWDAGHLA